MEEEPKTISVTLLAFRTDDLISEAKLLEVFKPDGKRVCFEATQLVRVNATGDLFKMYMQPAVHALLESIEERLIKEE